MPTLLSAAYGCVAVRGTLARLLTSVWPIGTSSLHHQSLPRCNNAVTTPAHSCRQYGQALSLTALSSEVHLANKVFKNLPSKLILVRHGESKLEDSKAAALANHDVPITDAGHQQALQAASQVLNLLAGQGHPHIHTYTSPFLRAQQTAEAMMAAWGQHATSYHEEPQLREQDWGSSVLPPEDLVKIKSDRLQYSRFYYRFANGESAADVYDRITVFQDHLVRDMNAGRFSGSSGVVLVTHGLTLRIFLMRWLHWSIAQFLLVDNPNYATPIVLEKVQDERLATSFQPYVSAATKSLYRLTPESQAALAGVTDDMCSTRTTWARDKMLQSPKARKAPLGSLTW